MKLFFAKNSVNTTFMAAIQNTFVVCMLKIIIQET